MIKEMYRGKRTDNQKWVTGYYYKIDEMKNAVNYSTTEPIPVHHYILVEEITDIGLPNQMFQVEVDPATICRGIQTEKYKIWENDIYEWLDNAYGKCTGIVRYGEYMQDGSGGEYNAIKCFGYYVEIVNVSSIFDETEHFYPKYLQKRSVLDILEHEECSILGNAFDNCDLCKDLRLKTTEI